MTRSLDWWLLYSGAALLVSAPLVGAQQRPPELALPGAGKVVRIVRTATPPVIDGLLDDEVWASAPFIEDLHQFRPLDHVEPSQRTRVYLLYDDANLYVAARLWDSEPDQIRVRALAQGQSVRWDDNFGIYLVPFNNDRTGYNFQANPNGVRSDAVFETPTDLNRDWEGIWTAEGNVDAEGWTIEMVIPFKTLNFDPENPDWGFNAERTIARNQEDIGWVSHNQRIDPSATGTVTGLTGLRQGRGLDLVPSIVTIGSKDFDARATDTAVEPSLDVFYNFTPSLTGVLTLNTDFSATEVDDRQINLTRFSLFFPEKRDFFLQDVDIFSFGGLERNGIPFFSRRIGLSGTGEPVDIEAGAKLTGRVGRWNVGALGVEQDAFGDVAGKDLFVGRVAANVLEESSVGMIVTDGDPRTNLDNTLVGFDFRYRNTRLPGGRTLEGEAWYQQSDTQGVIEDQRAWGARIASPNSIGLRGSVAFDRIDERFNPALGFVNRTGIERGEVWLGYTSRPEHRWIREVAHVLRLDNYDRISGGLESRSLLVTLFDLESHSGDVLSLTYDQEREVLLEPFEVSDGVIIPSGDYQFGLWRVQAFGANERVVAPSFRYGQGAFFDGERVQIGGGLAWRPNSRLFFDFGYQYNDITLPGGEFAVRLIAVRSEIAFNVRWSWLNLIQYDNESASVGVNSRLRWNPRAGQDLYVVVNHGFDAGGAFNRLHSQQAQLSVKYTHTFRL